MQILQTLCAWRSRKKRCFSMYAELHRTYGIRKDDCIPRGPVLLTPNSVAGLSPVAVSTCGDDLGRLRYGTLALALLRSLVQSGAVVSRSSLVSQKFATALCFTAPVRKAGSVLRRPMTVSWHAARTHPWRSSVPLLVQKHWGIYTRG